VNAPRVAPLTPLQPGDIVRVPLAPDAGPPGAPVVAVAARDWRKSQTIWLSVVGFLGASADGIVNVLIPIFTSADPVNWRGLWRPCAVAVLMAYIGWRRKRQNTIIN
jgi:hypothetical protein